MTMKSIKSPLTLLAIFIALTILSSCGRKGPLEAPQGSIVTQPVNGTTAAPANDRRIVLDGLI